jgi:hypothetical protein
MSKFNKHSLADAQYTYVRYLGNGEHLLQGLGGPREMM